MRAESNQDQAVLPETTADHAHCFVVLAYGDSPFLESCIEGLSAQTVASRILIATSTPSSFIRDVAARFGVEIRVNPLRENIGADWNFALRCAPNRYVTLAHQDDHYKPEFVQRSLDLFAKEPEAALCFTGYREIDDDGRDRTSKLGLVKHFLTFAIVGRREQVGGIRLRAFLSFGNPLPCSSVTFNRARLQDFSFSLDYASNLDWDAWCRLQQAGETFLCLREPLVGRRYNRLTETSRLIRSGTRRKEDLIMFRRLWPSPLGDAIAYLYRASY